MSKDLANQLISLGQQLSEERNQAYELWTWLPSYKVAEKYHSDYACEHCPSVRDVMVEAALCFARAKFREPDAPLSSEEHEWFERCPCGESHEEISK